MEPITDKSSFHSNTSQPESQPDITLTSLDRQDSLSQFPSVTNQTSSVQQPEIFNQNPNPKSTDQQAKINSKPSQIQQEENKLAEYLQTDSSNGNSHTPQKGAMGHDEAVGHTPPMLQEIGTAVPPNTPEFDEINRKTKSFSNQSLMGVIPEEHPVVRIEEDGKKSEQADRKKAEVLQQNSSQSLRTNSFRELEEGKISQDEKTFCLPVQIDPRRQEIQAREAKEEIINLRQGVNNLIQNKRSEKQEILPNLGSEVLSSNSEAKEEITNLRQGVQNLIQNKRSEKQEILPNLGSEVLRSNSEAKYDLPKKSTEMKPRSKTPPLNQSQVISLDPSSRLSSESVKRSDFQSGEEDKSPITESSSATSQVSTRSSITSENSKPLNSDSPSMSEISLFMPTNQSVEVQKQPQQSKVQLSPTRSETSRSPVIREEFKKPYIKSKEEGALEPRSPTNPTISGSPILSAKESSDLGSTYFNSEAYEAKLDNQMPESRDNMRTPEPRPTSKTTTYKGTAQESEDPKHEVSFNGSSNSFYGTPRSNRKLESREILDSLKKTQEARKLIGASTPVLNAIDKQLQKKESHEDSGIVPTKPLITSSVSEKKPTAIFTKVIIKDKQEIKTENETLTILKTICRTPPGNLDLKRNSFKHSEFPAKTLSNFLIDFSRSPGPNITPFKSDESAILNSSFNIPAGNSEQNTPHKLFHNIQESPDIPRQNDCKQCMNFKLKIDQLNIEIDSRTNEEVRSVQNIDKIMENHRIELTNILQEKDNLLSETVDLKFKMHKLNEEVDLAGSEMIDLRNLNSKLNLDLYNSNLEIKRLNEMQELSNRQNEKSEETVKDLNSLAEENGNLKKDIGDKIKAIDGYVRRMKELMQENETIKGLLKDDESKCKAYEEANKLLVKEIQGLTQEKDKNKALLKDSQDKCKNTEEANTVLLRAMNTFTEENNTLKELLKESQAKCITIEETIAGLYKENKDLDSRLKDAENSIIQFEDNIENLKGKHDVLNDSNQKLNLDFQDSIVIIAQLEEQKSNLENTQKTQAAEIEKLKGQIKSHLDTIQNCEALIKDKETKINDLTSQVEGLRSEIAQLKNTVKTLENDKNILNSEKANLASLLDANQSELKSSVETVKNLKSTKEKLEANIADLDNSLRIKHEDSNRQEAIITKNKRDIEKANKYIKELSEETRFMKCSLEDEKDQCAHKIEELEGAYLIKHNKQEKNHKDDMQQLNLKLKDSQRQVLLSQKTIESLNNHRETYKLVNYNQETQLECDSILKFQETLEGSFISEIRQSKSREAYIAMGVILGIVISYTLMYFKTY